MPYLVTRLIATILFTCLGLCATHAAPAADAATTARCSAYAKRAVEDFQLMSTHPACQVTGQNLAFNAGYDYHFSGCVKYPASLSEQADQYRHDYLQKCGAYTTPAAASVGAGSTAADPQAAPSGSTGKPLEETIVDTQRQLFNDFIEQVRVLNTDAAASLTDLEDVVYAFARYDMAQDKAAVHGAISRSTTHLQQKMGNVEFGDPITSAAQKTAIEDALHACADAANADSEAALAYALKLLITRYQHVARGELVFATERLVDGYLRAKRAGDSSGATEYNRQLGILQGTMRSNAFRYAIGPGTERATPAETQQSLAGMRRDVGGAWDAAIDIHSILYGQVLRQARMAAKLKAAEMRPPSSGPFKKSTDPRYITATVKGRVFNGQDPQDIFKAGADLAGLPFVLEVRFTDTVGGALGSTCAGPYGVSSATPEDIPVQASLTIGVKSYVFGRDGRASGSTDRGVRGTTPRIAGLYVRASEGSQPHPLGSFFSTVPMHMNAHGTGPEGSCDWRSSVALDMPDLAQSGFELHQGDSGSPLPVSGNLLPESVVVEGLAGPGPAKPAPPAPAVAAAPRNPIIGVWVGKDSGGVLRVATVEFTATEDISAGQHLKVRYAVAGGNVVVIPDNAPPRTCKIEGDAMSCQTPVGVLQYVRLK